MLMVVLAGVLVTAPRLMETVSGAVLTFAIAAGATGVVLASERFRHRERPRQTSKTA